MPYETERLSTILATHEDMSFLQPAMEQRAELWRAKYDKYNQPGGGLVSSLLGK